MVSEGFDIGALRQAAAAGRIQWHQHALERFLERGISRAEVVGAIMNGEVIEAHTTYRPYPRCLILHFDALPLHVVAACDPASGVCHVVTAYRPDTEHFEADFRTDSAALPHCTEWSPSRRTSLSMSKSTPFLVCRRASDAGPGIIAR